MSLSKECITCGKQGHTYLECPEVSFSSLFCGCLEIEPILGTSLVETRVGIEKLNLQRN